MSSGTDSHGNLSHGGSNSQPYHPSTVCQGSLKSPVMTLQQQPTQQEQSLPQQQQQVGETGAKWNTG